MFGMFYQDTWMEVCILRLTGHYKLHHLNLTILQPVSKTLFDETIGRHFSVEQDWFYPNSKTWRVLQSAHLLLSSGEMSPDDKIFGMGFQNFWVGTHVKKGSGEMSLDDKIIGIRFLLQKIIYSKILMCTISWNHELCQKITRDAIKSKD